ncbi:MAG: hypothetical protein HY231_21490 [Acidobacteria bacterium]|nr:hypothetical protein [Acidobacteriota bacterium]
MKKKDSKPIAEEVDEMLPEYDFRGGVRGKHYKAYRQGHTVTIHQNDGSTIVQHFTLEDGAVMLERDVREYFPDSESVNKALRCLIPLVPKKRKTKRKAPLAQSRA